MNLGEILPCEECRMHYYEDLDENKLLDALVSNETFFRYIYDLHNRVNKKLGVPESTWPSYDSVRQKYSSFEAKCSDIPGVCGPKTSYKKFKIVEEGLFSEDNYQFIIIIGLLCIALAASMYYKVKKV